MNLVRGEVAKIVVREKEGKILVRRGGVKNVVRDKRVRL